MAVAMTYVIAAAEIDLSVGAVAGLTSVVTAMSISQFGLVPGIVAGLATGLIVGAVNGAIVSLLAVPSFLVTLGMIGLATGLSRWKIGRASCRDRVCQYV